MEVLNIEVGAGKTNVSVNSAGKLYRFNSPARTISIINTGDKTLYASAGDASLAGLLGAIQAGVALPIPPGRTFVFEATYPRLHALAIAAASGDQTTATFGVF